MKYIAALFFILFFTIPAQAEHTLQLGYIGAPLSYASLSVLKAAYAKIGYTVIANKAPGERSLTDSNAGLNDGEVHRIKSIASQYPKLIRVEVPINYVEGMLISCNTSYTIESLADLIPYRVVVRIGNKYATKLTKNLPYVIKTPDTEKMVTLLMEGRADMILSDRPWAMSQQMRPGKECLIINEPPLVTIPLYHYLHQKNAAIVPKITQILQSMHDNGESETIRQKALEKRLQTDIQQ